MPRSTYRLTVPQDFYDAVCEACGQPFADSYVFGATLTRSRLTPRTVTAWQKMRDRRDFLHLLKTLNTILDKPAPWPGDGTRLAGKDCFG
jgi:hypothetical protein